MTKKEQQFVKTVYDFYERHGRRSLPWRKTFDPYRILVSEIMLQQTQVDRVIPKYETFIKEFPTIGKLAAAPLGAVLRVWQGLGYNRRAKMLHAAAKEMAAHRGRVVPRTRIELESLPGVGPYTAGAVLAFAYNTPTPLIETNIRTVFLHHFFKNKKNVSDADILTFVARTLDQKHSRDWYYALMDYGTYLKKTFGNQNTRSKTYAKQTRFKGSDREIRGAIIRALTSGAKTKRALKVTLKEYDAERIDEQLQKLIEEELITRRKSIYTLPV